MIGMLGVLAIWLHRNWPGAVSTREHQAKLVGVQPTLLAGVLAAINDYTGRAPLQTYEDSSSSGSMPGPPMPPPVTRAWHVWVARTLPLISKQIRIDELRDWYAEEQLFIGRYGQQNQILGVLCLYGPPSNDKLAAAINFITTEAGKPIRIIVAIENVVGNRRREFLSDVEIDWRPKNEILDSLVDFTPYRQFIRFSYEAAALSEGYDLTLPKIYVPSAGFTKYHGDQRRISNVESYVFSWISEQTLRQIAIIGEYGQGKSVLALRIAYRLLFEEDTSSRIPLLITLGGRSPRNQTPLGLLADWAAPYGINPLSLVALHEQGRLLLIFDAFDEMDMVAEPSLRRSHFRTLWEFTQERKAKILITGRPNFFLDDVEREASLLIRDKSLEIPYTEAVYLQSFDLDQIKKALRSFDPQTKTGILTVLQDPNTPESFRELASRPSTLFLSGNIWKEILTSGNLEHIKSADVIRQFIQHSYDRQQSKRIEFFLSTLEREYFMIGIANGMFEETGLSNHTNKQRLRLMVSKLLTSFSKDFAAFQPAADRELKDLQVRLQDRDLLIDTICADVRSCGILVTDLSQSDSFKFAHKSFFELLVASNTVIHLLRNSTPTKDTLINATARTAIVSRPDEVGRLTVEMYQFAGELPYSFVCGGKEISRREAEKLVNGQGIRAKKIRNLSYFLQHWPYLLFIFPQVMTIQDFRVGFILYYCFESEGGAERVFPAPSRVPATIRDMLISGGSSN